MENGVQFYAIPNGSGAFAGGTRRQVNVSRPWQGNLPSRLENCPLCKKEIIQQGDFWRVVSNSFTPYDFHELIIPNDCPTGDYYDLGGTENLAEIIKLATKRIFHKDAKGDKFFELNVHIGRLAGQNQAHIHFHLLIPPEVTPFTQIPVDCKFAFPGAINSLMNWLGKLRNKPDLLITKTSQFSVVAAGYRAGQCFFIPSGVWKLSDASDLPNLISKVIALYGDRFKDPETSLRPEYKLGFLIDTKGIVRFGTYVPVLNQWGLTEDMALLRMQPATLPWSHEETVKFLNWRD